MTNETVEIIKMVSGGVSFLAYFLYAVSMPFGTTRPSRSSWWILSAVWIITLLSSIALAPGETFIEQWRAVEGNWISLSYIAGSLLIAILTIWWHKRGAWKTLDYLCAVSAGIAVILYVAIETYSTLYAGTISMNLVQGLFMASLATSLLADFFGIIPTIQNAWANPKSESLFAWSLEVVASFLTLIPAVIMIKVWALSVDIISGLSVPIYLVVMNGIIVFVILKRTPNKKKKST